ncbi:adenosylcobinamide-GDP ribazoletransferase [Beggiatoa leptomitoformis]|uniref:Adenosylcobinamide-GDP ribazoletransferase n=1 Tax=Beggiatoa leptomitoformis TaxID=288004 RepID=A0A2N9YAP3_9GAMM|nr:adenosylcobinamide-GDP ribazoletransferase [Beggiatoa leptomitoformis]ALG67088.1 adenosylcobinamide-GDP ribazoletransferase [Beggiatoa leptomitoformis]AUI67520.1 adenosylcobinamide-GDP ribazoletransferase [Beggiatoa leptomitoformis]
MSFFKKELQLFFIALMFYTRLPCPAWVGYSDAYLSQATKYFPLMGWIVGGFAALIFLLADLLFSLNIAVLLSMIASILLTGAFHEDGLADVCDGFGGGWTKIRILEIMKDSRVGSYGTIGMNLTLLLKFSALTAMSPELIPYALIAGHSISRFATNTIIATATYVRENDDSKAKPIAKGTSLTALIIAGLLGVAPFMLLPSYGCLLAIVPVFFLTFYLRHYFNKQIGGYTGDCLGATQQLTELLFYLTITTEFWTSISFDILHQPS